MGESEPGVLRIDFDRRLKLEFHGSKITSDGGLLPVRELDDALGLTDLVGEHLVDPRTGKNGQHGMIGLFRHSTFSRLGGYEDVNDADRLGHDPATWWIVASSTSAIPTFNVPLTGRDCHASRVGPSLINWPSPREISLNDMVCDARICF